MGFEDEEGAMSQKVQADSRSWKRQGNDFPMASRRNTALLTP